MKTTINYFNRMLCVFLLSAGVALTSCEETDPIDDNKTEQGGNDNNANEGGDENSGNGNEGGENTGAADDFTTWTTIVGIAFALLLIIYLKDIFIFFVEKKIPFLYLILYLCTAILLPLSFLITLLPQQVG